jgi:MFS family permease
MSLLPAKAPPPEQTGEKQNIACGHKLAGLRNSHPLAGAVRPQPSELVAMDRDVLVTAHNRLEDEDVVEPATSLEWDAARWLRVLAFAVIMVCTVGLQYTYGVMLVAFADAFPDAHHSLLVSIGSVSFGAMEASAVVSGTVIGRWSERATCILGGVVAGLGLLIGSFSTKAWHLVVTYGLVMGFGHSLSLFSGVVILNKIFTKRRSLAAGIGCTGGGLGTIIFSALLPHLLERFGVFWTLRILASVILVGCSISGLIMTKPFASTYRFDPPPAEGHARERERVCDGQVDDVEGGLRSKSSSGSRRCFTATRKDILSSWMDATRSLPIRLSLVGLILSATGLMMPIVTVVRFAEHHGWEGQKSTMLVSCLGIGSLSFRVPISLLADATGPRTILIGVLYLYGVLLLCAGGGLLVHLYGALVVYAVCWGGLLGSFMAIVAPMMAAIVRDDKHMVQATTMAFTCVGCGFMVGPAVAGGLFRDLDQALLFCGVCVIGGAGAVHMSVAADRRSPVS